METTRIFDLLGHQALNYPLDIALAGKVNGEWVTYSTAEFIEQVKNVSLGLLAAGVKKGDRIAIISNNRPEWNFVDFGILQTGAVNVPIYPTISENDLKFILDDSGAGIVFVSSSELLKKVNRSSGSSVKKVYTFDRIDGAAHWSEITDEGKMSSSTSDLEGIKEGVDPGDLATILYTSGTTGTPKGVMLSHNNLVSNFLAVRNLPPNLPGEVALSFLPLNHIYERMLTYLYMYIGVSVYYAESLDTIGDNIREIKPHVFSAVPRLLEKVYERIVAKGKALTGIKKKLFFWSISVGEKYDPSRRSGPGYRLSLWITRKLVFSKWQEGLGGNVKAIVSGGAALNPRLARIFLAAGVNVLEGYGCTETSPVIAVNTLENDGIRIGTVGPVIEGVEVKIAEDGEILCRGPNVMLGYFNRDDLTAEVIDKEGFYHTGDIGEIVENRFLKITDRKKEIFKTSGGKYIAPQMIENRLKESPFIEQSMVVGENQKFASALIVPAFDHIREWAKHEGIDIGSGSKEEISASSEVKKKIMKEISLINSSLAQFESIKRVELLPREWTIEKGEITPKLSLKRKVILESFREAVDRIYND